MRSKSGLKVRIVGSRTRDAKSRNRRVTAETWAKSDEDEDWSERTRPLMTAPRDWIERTRPLMTAPRDWIEERKKKDFDEGRQ